MKKSFCLYKILTMSLLILFQINSCSHNDFDSHNVSKSTPTAVVTTTPTPIPLTKYILKSGDTIYSVLCQNGLSSADADNMISSCRSMYNLAKVSAGKTIKFRIVDDVLSEFLYDIDKENFVKIENKEGKFKCSLEKKNFIIENKVFSNSITSSFWAAAIEVNLDPHSLMELAAIFDWDIDFNTEFRKNDSFSVIIEAKLLAGKFHHFGKILAANFVVNGKNHAAIRFQTSNGRVDYFDLSGNCLRKNFLKAPLKYTRISSRFSAHRFHPILKIVRPHWGVDYAAPSGTPVRSLADGVVIFAGRNGGYGNYCKIKHGSSPYITGYGHLKGFARGIRKGKHVKQGQIIGYVGKTGLATGPHLDFRVYYYGKPINPLKIKAKPARKLPEKDNIEFTKLAQKLFRKMKITNIL